MFSQSNANSISSKQTQICKKELNSKKELKSKNPTKPKKYLFQYQRGGWKRLESGVPGGSTKAYKSNIHVGSDLPSFMRVRSYLQHPRLPVTSQTSPSGGSRLNKQIPESPCQTQIPNPSAFHYRNPQQNHYPESRSNSFCNRTCSNYRHHSCKSRSQTKSRTCPLSANEARLRSQGLAGRSASTSEFFLVQSGTKGSPSR